MRTEVRLALVIAPVLASALALSLLLLHDNRPESISNLESAVVDWGNQGSRARREAPAVKTNDVTLFGPDHDGDLSAFSDLEGVGHGVSGTLPWESDGQVHLYLYQVSSDGFGVIEAGYFARDEKGRFRIPMPDPGRYRLVAVGHPDPLELLVASVDFVANSDSLELGVLPLLSGTIDVAVESASPIGADEVVHVIMSMRPLGADGAAGAVPVRVMLARTGVTIRVRGILGGFVEAAATVRRRAHPSMIAADWSSAHAKCADPIAGRRIVLHLSKAEALPRREYVDLVVECSAIEARGGLVRIVVYDREGVIEETVADPSSKTSVRIPPVSRDPHVFIGSGEGVFVGTARRTDAGGFRVEVSALEVESVPVQSEWEEARLYSVVARHLFSGEECAIRSVVVPAGRSTLSVPRQIDELWRIELVSASSAGVGERAPVPLREDDLPVVLGDSGKR